MSVALLLLAHKGKEQIDRLINHLIPDFDIYMHIDKGSNILMGDRKNVHVYKKYKTYWGSVNLIKATLLLLKEAFKEKYDRYVLISGQDLPIKSNKEIKNYFENNINNYIEIYKMPYEFGNFDSPMSRVTKYWPIQNFRWKDGKNFIRKIIYKIKTYALNISFNLRPRKLDYTFYGGSQWFNLTNDCVGDMLSYIETNPKFLKRFQFTQFSDEIFFQTLANILNIKINNASLRYIDWEKGPDRPRTLRVDDYQSIINSNNLFARKFDSGIDNEIIDLIYHAVSETS